MNCTKEQPAVKYLVCSSTSNKLVRDLRLMLVWGVLVLVAVSTEERNVSEVPRQVTWSKA